MLKFLYVMLPFSLLSGCTAVGLVADGIGGASSQAQPASAPMQIKKIMTELTMA
jgi:hypothetical protein